MHLYINGAKPFTCVEELALPHYGMLVPLTVSRMSQLQAQIAEIRDLAAELTVYETAGTISP